MFVPRLQPVSLPTQNILFETTSLTVLSELPEKDTKCVKPVSITCSVDTPQKLPKHEQHTSKNSETCVTTSPCWKTLSTSTSQPLHRQNLCFQWKLLTSRKLFQNTKQLLTVHSKPLTVHQNSFHPRNCSAQTFRLTHQNLCLIFELVTHTVWLSNTFSIQITVNILPQNRSTVRLRLL